MRELWNRLRGFLNGRHRVAEELDEEIREHFRMQTQHFIDA
jgi:hypothetical protein